MAVDIGKRAKAIGKKAPKEVAKRLKRANPSVHDVTWNPKVGKYQAWRNANGRPICIKQGTDPRKMAHDMQPHSGAVPEDSPPDQGEVLGDAIEHMAMPGKTRLGRGVFTGSNSQFRAGYDGINWKRGRK
jgi:hypothetical protein